MAMVNRGRVHARACQSRPAKTLVVGQIGMVSPESGNWSEDHGNGGFSGDLGDGGRGWDPVGITLIVGTRSIGLQDTLSQ